MHSVLILYPVSNWVINLDFLNSAYTDVRRVHAIKSNQRTTAENNFASNNRLRTRRAKGKWSYRREIRKVRGGVPEGSWGKKKIKVEAEIGKGEL